MSVPQFLKDAIRLPVVLLRVHIRIFAGVRVSAEQILVTIVVEIVDSRAPPAHPEGCKSDPGLIGSHREKFSVLVAEKRKRFATKRRYENAWSPAVAPIAESRPPCLILDYHHRYIRQTIRHL